MKENSQIMIDARESLKGKWSLAVGSFFIIILISIGASLIPAVGQFIGFLIAGPIAVGSVYFALKISRDQEAKTDDLFFGFNNCLGNSILAYLLIVVFVFVRLLLLIVPGIIAGLAYSQTWFILSEDPSIDPNTAILKSKKMMDGYKFKLFKIQLRLFGLVILCLFTLGIGFLWLVPYQYVVYSKFYDELKSSSN